MSRRRRAVFELRKSWAVSGLLVAFLVGSWATPQVALAQGGPGFLFTRPSVTFSVRAGYDVPRASSEIFNFVVDSLTVKKSDFNSPAIAADLGIHVTERLDLVLGIGYAISEIQSEFRDWVDGDDLPIEQTTRHSKLPFTLSARYHLRDRGRTLGRFAWVPTRFSPYVGAGGGLIRYEFEQVGDFVDFETLDVFTDRFLSDGAAATAHLFGGFQASVGGQFVLMVEGRYSWSKEPMSADFIDFDDIDLTGFQANIGVGVRL